MNNNSGYVCLKIYNKIDYFLFFLLFVVVVVFQKQKVC